MQTPATVTAVQKVDLALVEYVNDEGNKVTQLALVGEQSVQLLESRMLGLSEISTPAGRAVKWLADGILKVMRPVKTTQKAL